jgi:NHL repeat
MFVVMKVSEIDCSGCILRTFTGVQDGSSQQPLDMPRHLALDSDGRVLVADTGNDRILLLNPDLDFERVLLNRKDGSLERKPWRICLIEHSAQLIVGYCESKHVAVFRVRPKGKIVIYQIP